MKKQKIDRKQARTWRVVMTLLLIALGLFILRENRTIVSTSLSMVVHAHPSWVLLSVLLMALTFCLAATTYKLLALRPIRYAQTLLVEVAAAFVGRLLPAGLGGLGLNGVYLYKRRHTPAEATVVTSVNNLIGMCAHVLLICIVVFFRPHVLSQLLANRHVGDAWKWAIVAVVAMLLVLSLPVVRVQLIRFGHNLLASVRKENPKRVCLAVFVSAMLTLTYTLVLCCTSRSVGVDLSPVQLFVVFTVGVAVGTITPAPGGLVGTEAGLYAALMSFGASSPGAGAAVLLFRLITYWLPLLPGAGALLIARYKKMV